MKFSYAWLKEWIDWPQDVKHLLERLTMSGLEVDQCEKQSDGDYVITLDMTPNRADCLSIQGIARDLAAVTGTAIHIPINSFQMPPPLTDKLSITLAHPFCCHYRGCIIRNINNKRSTPEWLQQRLTKSGIQLVAPIVDITNYIMLELGQPLHAFALSSLEGGITARLAKENESLRLLDDTEIALTTDDLIISDDKKPIALAGIMGGLATGVQADSCDIFLESAFFDPVAVALTARRHRIHSDASFRFERGVDPLLAEIALMRATKLICQLFDGKAAVMVSQIQVDHIPKAKQIQFSPHRVKKILGIDIDYYDIQAILLRLNMSIHYVNNHWQVIPPSYRFDLAIENDLIEEIARITSYDQIPPQPLTRSLNYKKRKESQLSSRDIMNLLKSRGYYEVINYSFISAKQQQQFDENLTAISLHNPISSDMAVMRTNLWPGLVNNARYNLNRQASRLRLVECGRRFLPTGEQDVISGLILGQSLPEQAYTTGDHSDRLVNFFDLKGDIEALLALSRANRTHQFSFLPSQHVALHPNQCAAIYNSKKEMIGMMGALHPRLCQLFEFNVKVYLFELLLQPLLVAHTPKYQSISKFPMIRRDLAFIVASNVASVELLHCIGDTAGDYLVDLFIFDIYQGEKIEKGKKSIAFALILQDFSRTLKEVEIEKIIKRVIGNVEKRYAATLRN